MGLLRQLLLSTKYLGFLDANPNISQLLRISIRARESKINDGVLTGIRTPVPTVKGSCPRPLDDEDNHFPAYAELLKTLVEVSGIEPLTSCMPCKRSPS